MYQELLVLTVNIWMLKQLVINAIIIVSIVTDLMRINALNAIGIFITTFCMKINVMDGLAPQELFSSLMILKPVMMNVQQDISHITTNTD